MAIQFVNGFQCKDCTDVANAKKHIDPAHPKDGPYGINKPPTSADALQRPGAVLYGGSLAALNTVQAANGATSPDPARSGTGTLLNQSV